METFSNRLRAVMAVLAVTMFIALAGTASATTLTMGTNDGLVDNVYHLGPTYTEQGYTFTSAAGDLVTWGNGYAVDPDPTDSVSLIPYHPMDAVTLTREDGGLFNLGSIDFRGYQGATNEGTGILNLSWVFGNGTTGSGTILVLLDKWTTDLLSLQGLKSITWQPDTTNLNWAWADNVQVTATPIPAALPLFLSALGGIGLLARRRRIAMA